MDVLVLLATGLRPAQASLAACTEEQLDAESDLPASWIGRGPPPLSPPPRGGGCAGCLISAVQSSLSAPTGVHESIGKSYAPFPLLFNTL